tara:strand:- start:32 stop:304 length:273 start_codon:yes stop_codon:yes gene_type:complete
MFKLKYYLVIILLLINTNCASPGSALLGPAFTGATTKSMAQASLSFGTNQIIRQIHETSLKSKREIKKIVKKIDSLHFNLKVKDQINFHK